MDGSGGWDAPGLEPQRAAREGEHARIRKRKAAAGTPAALSRLPLGIYNLARILDIVNRMTA
jgi:hypothetical protein